MELRCYQDAHASCKKKLEYHLHFEIIKLNCWRNRQLANDMGDKLYERYYNCKFVEKFSDVALELM